MEEQTTTAAETQTAEAKHPWGALREVAMTKILHLQEYMADHKDNAPHLMSDGKDGTPRTHRPVDFRPASVVVEEALAAFDAAVAAGAPMHYTRDHVAGMRLGAQRAYARRMLSKTFEAAMMRILEARDIGDPRAMFQEAAAAVENISTLERELNPGKEPPYNHLRESVDSLMQLLLRTPLSKEEAAKGTAEAA